MRPPTSVNASVLPNENGYDAAQRLDFYTNTRDRIRALPGVEQAAWTEWAPLATVSEGGPVWIDGQPPRTGEQAYMAALASVDAEYFTASKVAILEGRSFDARDASTERQVAIVNETLAGHFWPNQSAIGRSLVIRGERVDVVGRHRDAVLAAELEERRRPDRPVEVAVELGFWKTAQQRAVGGWGHARSVVRLAALVAASCREDAEDRAAVGRGVRSRRKPAAVGDHTLAERDLVGGRGVPGTDGVEHCRSVGHVQTGGVHVHAHAK